MQNLLFQASAGKLMITALFLVIMQRVVVMPCQNFGTKYRSLLQGSRLEIVPVRFINNIKNYIYIYIYISCCLWTFFEIMFKRMASGFSPAIPGSFRRTDPVRSVAETVTLVPVMLQFFHFFPASNHFPSGLILTYSLR